VDSAAVLDVLGLAGNLQTAQLLEHILRRDAQSALLLLDQLYTGGKDVGAVLGELSTLVRDLLLRRTAPEGGAALLSGGYDNATLDRLGEGVSGSRFLYLATTLQKASADLYYSSNRRTDAELCIIRLCDETLSGDLTALETRVQRLEDAAARGQTIRAAVAVSAAAAPQKAPLEPPKAPPKPKAEDTPPWDDGPPLPEEPPMPDEPGERVFDIPPEPVKPVEAPKAPVSAPVPAAESAPQTAAPMVGGGWWRALVEGCKGRLPPMYRVFLDMCTGVLEGDQLTIYAPDDITLGRLDNDRVKGALSEEAVRAAGTPVRLLFRVGEPPKSSPQENLKNLLKFGSQFDNIEIK
jgi:DNA polymerase-3 subunit gamma/tau